MLHCVWQRGVLYKTVNFTFDIAFDYVPDNEIKILLQFATIYFQLKSIKYIKQIQFKLYTNRPLTSSCIDDETNANTSPFPNQTTFEETHSLKVIAVRFNFACKFLMRLKI